MPGTAGRGSSVSMIWCGVHTREQPWAPSKLCPVLRERGTAWSGHCRTGWARSTLHRGKLCGGLFLGGGPAGAEVSVGRLRVCPERLSRAWWEQRPVRRSGRQGHPEEGAALPGEGARRPHPLSFSCPSGELSLLQRWRGVSVPGLRARGHGWEV